MAAHKVLTDQQVLDWRDMWSFTDRAFIEHALAVLPGHEVTDRGHGELVVRVRGKKAFVIRPGFVYWPKGTWASDVDPTLIPGGLLVGGEGDGTLWSRLSTIRSYDSKGSGRSFNFGVCPVHFIQLPATGMCDDCS